MGECTCNRSAYLSIIVATNEYFLSYLSLYGVTGDVSI